MKTLTLPMILGIIFIVLKLCNVIHWSWWYVTMPFWIGLIISLIMVLGVAIYIENKRKL